MFLFVCVITVKEFHHLSRGYYCFWVLQVHRGRRRAAQVCLQFPWSSYDHLKWRHEHGPCCQGSEASETDLGLHPWINHFPNFSWSLENKCSVFPQTQIITGLQFWLKYFWHSALKGVWLLQDSRDEAAEAPEVLLKLQQNEQNLRLKPTMSGGFCDPRRPWSSASSVTRQEWGVLEFLSTQSSYLDPPSSLLFLPAFRPLSCLPWIRRTA